MGFQNREQPTMPAVDSIRIRGFKSIRDLEVDLRPVNVLIGANGSGKSNFIGAFSFLREIRSGRLQSYVTRAGGADRVLYFGSRRTTNLSVHVFFKDKVNEYEINLAPTADDLLSPNDTVSFLNKELGYERPYSWHLTGRYGEAGISVSEDVIAQHVRRRLDGWRLYHLHDTGFHSPMKKTGDVDDNRFLREDGSNLAAFLYLLSQKHESSYRLIRRTVQLAAPFFDDFIVLPQKLNPDKIRLEWKHTGSDTYFDSSSLSDGTLRFMALATLLLQPVDLRPSVILLDEPELGLHPYAIAVLASLMQKASVDTQIIVATQSPILLDYFEPEDVLVADRVNGETKLTRLNSEELSTWLEDYSLGQLWEKNWFGGRPVKE